MTTADPEFSLEPWELGRLFENLVAGVVVHDGEGVVLTANPAACALMDRTLDQMVGRGLSDPSWRLLREDGSTMESAEYPAAVALSTGVPLAGLLVGVAHGPQDSPSVWVMCDAYLERLEDSTVRRAVVMFVDITAKIRLERQRADTYRQYKLLFDHIGEGVLITLSGQTILAANPAACTLFGASEAALVGSHQRDLLDPTDARGAKFYENRRVNDCVVEAVRLIRRDGTAFEAEVSSALYPAADGTLLSSVVIRDLSLRAEVARAEEALQSAERRERRKGEFLAKVSHELRTPLNGMLGMAQVMLLADAMPEPAQTRLRQILQSGEHLAKMIDDLLDVAALDAGLFSLHSRSIDIGRTVAEVVANVEEAAVHQGVALVLGSVEEGAFVHADDTRVRQIVLNLLTNGIKYNRPGGRLGVSGRVRQDRYVVEVSDTGIGMTADQLNSLFSPFHRLGREHTGVPGMGLGLSLAKDLAERMSGTLEVASVPGGGSTFTLGLPLVDAPDDEIFPETRDSALGGLIPASLLYVDDDVVNRLVVEGMAKALGVGTVLQAANGQEGLRLAASHRPSIVLTDLLMADMDGYAFLTALRSDPVLAAIPCLAVSALTDEDDVASALGAGFDGYIKKPIYIRAFRRAILTPFRSSR